MAWIVCGFIATSKGKDINQAKVVESTTKEKACRDEVKAGARLTIVKIEQPWVVDSGKSLDYNERPLHSQLQSLKTRLEIGGQCCC